MIAGTVVGEVWATRKSAGLEGRKLVLVAALNEDRLLVAVDTLEARAGQRVLVSWGSGARKVLAEGGEDQGVLCDAAVSLLVDGEAIESGGSRCS